MNANIQNGGLILLTDKKLYLSDVKSFSGTNEIPTNLANHHIAITKGVFWFMNKVGNDLYYSDQKRGHALCRMEIDSRNEELILDKPCYKLLYSDEWIYYINEDDQRLYRCRTDGKHEMKWIDEHVECFLIEDGLIYYASPQGIRMCNETGAEKETICDAVATSILRLGDKLAFADKSNSNQLTLFDLKTGLSAVYDRIEAVSMNTDGSYLYCANRLNGNSIYRMDPATGSSIRICGESADYLHVADDELYFCNKREWHRLSLSGGEASRILV